MIFVVGSGPAGVWCAKALLEKGKEVTLLDAGIELDAATQGHIQKLSGRHSKEWSAEDIAFMKAGTQASIQGIPRKLAYGSDFAYQGTSEHIPMMQVGTNILPSFARGGLSTVWGAAMLPYRAEDIRDWPITISDLSPHYQAVVNGIPFAAEQDDLDSIFPLYARPTGGLPTSRQSETWFTALQKNRQPLQAKGIWSGHARLAVKSPISPSSGCQTCGLCLYGCPYGYIYSSADTLNDLKRNPHFNYQGDIVVEKVSETSGDVVLHTRHRRNGDFRSFKGERVFLACGVLPTTYILVNSLGLQSQDVALRYSHHFMFPMITAHAEKDVRTERLHTLAQIFLEILDPSLSEEAIHLQIYSYNDLYPAALENSAPGMIFRLFPGLADPFLNRLLIVQGYLHSKQSGTINFRVEKRPSGLPELSLTARKNPQTRPKIHQVMRKILANARYLKAIPLLPWLKIAEEGVGYHIGGTFPMQTDPGSFATDRLGRPHGLKRVHAVDATIFPSLPATTITLSVMANAHRIGMESAAL